MLLDLGSFDIMSYHVFQAPVADPTLDHVYPHPNVCSPFYIFLDSPVSTIVIDMRIPVRRLRSSFTYSPEASTKEGTLPVNELCQRPYKIYAYVLEYMSWASQRSLLISIVKVLGGLLYSFYKWQYDFDIARVTLDVSCSGKEVANRIMTDTNYRKPC